MRNNFVFIFVILFFNSLTAQKSFFSIGTGISGLTSNYKEYYKDCVNYNAKIGYQKFYSKAGLRLTLGYYNYRNWKEKVKAKLCYNFIRFSGGPIYKITPTWTLVSQIQIGVPTQTDLYNEFPRYQYNLDPVDIGYSIEIAKSFGVKNCKDCFGFGFGFSKSIGTPVNNLFLWDDKNRPYYLNLNFYYFLDESTQIKPQ